MVNIASCLSDRGHIVDVCIYNPQINFFEKRLKDKGVKVLICDKRITYKLSFIKSIYSILYTGRYDIAMSFLDTPNLILELISKFVKKTVFIASERSSYVGFYNHKSFLYKGNFRGFFHSLVDHVLTNSNTQMKWVRTRYPYLKNKTSCIYNGFEICNDKVERIRNNNTRLRLLAVGRISPEKNTINLIHGLNLFLQENKWLPSISWIGARDRSTSALKNYNIQIDELLDSLPEVKSQWKWEGEKKDVSSYYKSYDYLIHPSIYEGLPNVICEALLDGMPVLASNVCDNGLLVKEGERGFLFDPQSPQDISMAIARCVNLPDKEYSKFSRNCQKYAYENFDLEKQVIKFENLFDQLLAC
jgi:glycosyltransferase involved in cell wall biosynthesis